MTVLLDGLASTMPAPNLSDPSADGGDQRRDRDDKKQKAQDGDAALARAALRWLGSLCGWKPREDRDSCPKHRQTDAPPPADRAQREEQRNHRGKHQP
ncbi:MAG TPA: hypothetical protein VI318_10420 [Baekduia sp.]